VLCRCMLEKLLIGLLRVSIKILFLEDDLLFAETLVDLLEDAGYLVTHSPNGQDALDITFKNKFDSYMWVSCFCICFNAYEIGTLILIIHIILYLIFHSSYFSYLL